MLFIVGNGKRKRVVLLIRNPRSKRYDLTCFCKRPRKDGTCRFTDEVSASVSADKAHLVRLRHPEVDERTFPLPELKVLA